MKKKNMGMILTVTLLMTAGCGAKETPMPEAPATPTAEETVRTEETAPAEETLPEEAKEYVTTGGTPWIDSDIRENITADMITDPRDDFHLYANKDWILNSEVPEGYSGWSHYQERAYDVKQQCMELLKDESIEGHDAEQIRTLNALILDWDARNASGITEIRDLYDRIMAVNCIEDVNTLLTDPETVGELYSFMYYEAATDLENPQDYIVYVTEPWLILGDSAEYPDRTEYGDILYGYKKDLFIYIAEKMGMSENDAAECFDSAIDIETKLSEKIYTVQEKYSEDYFDRINNRMTYEEMTALTKGYPLGDILVADEYRYGGTYIVSYPEYFELLDEIYTDENIEEIRDLLMVNYLLTYKGAGQQEAFSKPARCEMANLLDRETYEKMNGLFNQYFGTSGMAADEEKAYDLVARLLPTSMQKVYIEKYGSEEDREKMEELCRMVIDTYREILEENDWASEEVKTAAIEKLDHITIHAAYPDRFPDTSGIELPGCSLIEAYDVIREQDKAYNRSLIGTKRDPEMWAEGFDLLSCNAFYDPTDNSINMVIGMMGEPFYSGDMDTEELYASIGAFWVGHEISHAFDSNGAQFDAQGQYRDWWTAGDKEEFGRRIAKMDDYLDSIVAFGDHHFIGANIDTEMAADMTGVQCALRMAAKVDGFDYDRFFIKYAQMNASLMVYSNELSSLQTDAHPLDYSRTNVPVQQFEEFYETYGVEEGDNMYLAPEERLLIW